MIGLSFSVLVALVAQSESDPVEHQAASLGVVALEDDEVEGPPRLLDAESVAALAEMRLLPRDAVLQRALHVATLDVPTLTVLATVTPSPPPPQADGGPAAADTPPTLTPLQVARRTLARRVLEERTGPEQALLRNTASEQAGAQERANAEKKRAEQSAELARERAAASASAGLAKLYTTLADLETQNEAVASALVALHEKAKGIADEQSRDEAEAARYLAGAQKFRDRSTLADSDFNTVRINQDNATAAFWDAMEKRAADGESDAVVQNARAVLGAAAPGQIDKPEFNSLNPEQQASLRKTVYALEEARAKLNEQLNGYDDARADIWFEVARGYNSIGSGYQQARLALMDKLSSDFYGQLHALTDEKAHENLQTAFKHLAAQVRFFFAKRLMDIKNLPARLFSPVAGIALFFALLQAGAVVLFVLFLRRRWPSWQKKLKAYLLQDVTGQTARRRRESFFALFEASAPYAAVMVTAIYLFRLLEPHGPTFELTTALIIGLFVLGYRWASKLLHVVMVKTAQRHLRLDPQAKLKMLRSVRLLMRYLFVMAFALKTTAALVGGGILYANARLGAIFGLIVVLLVIAYRWRNEIASAYKSENADTAIARALSDTEVTLGEFPYALGALAVLAGRAAMVLGKDFVLGFEQTRRALAYIFRLRIERQAKDKPSPVVEIEALPDAMKVAFADEPTTDRSILINRFDEVPETAKRIGRDTARTGMVLIHGPYGIGRTTWLMQLEQALEEDVHPLWWSPTTRITTRAELVRAAADLFDVDFAHGEESLETLVKELNTRPQTAVFLDGLEWFFLRELNGYAALDALFELISRTQDTFAWAVTVPTPTYLFLDKAHRIQDHASAIVELKPWSEEDIRQLLDRRQKRSGCTVSFEDLVTQTNNTGQDPGVLLEETKQGYIRLLWSFAEGNPRLAQHFWLRSLIRQNQVDLRCQLYTAPTAADLEVVPEADRFILSAFVLHRSLTARQAARACNIDIARVHAHMRRGRERGIYVECPSGNGRFVISTLWWEGTLRFLRRKNLLIVP